MNDFEELWSLLQEFEKCWAVEQEKRPFHLNLLDYCRTYENAHTQILLKILHYKENAEYLLINSFLRKIGVDIRWNRERNDAKIEFNKDFIDGYLCDGTYAIIIENKINNAVDQEHQIESYVDKVKERGFELGKIYVFYLTKDGSKQVSEISCPSSLRDDLGERFVEINYRDHILPWLKEDILPRCKIKDEIFISALRQYIDFLEGIFGFRKGDEEMDKDIIDSLKKLLSFENGSWAHHEIVDEKIKHLHKLTDYLDRVVHEVKNSVVSITREYWNKEYGEDVSIGDGMNGNWQFLYFGNSRWNLRNRLLIHLEWQPITERILFESTQLTMHLHLERSDVQKYINCLESDPNYLDMLDAAEMAAVRTNDSNIKLNYQKTIEFEKTLAQMTEDERKKVLFSEYDKVKPLLDYVYKKCEECDSKN